MRNNGLHGKAGEGHCRADAVGRERRSVQSAEWTQFCTLRFAFSIEVVVPGERIELSWCCHRGILSPVRLPIPPSRLGAQIIAEINEMRNQMPGVALAGGIGPCQVPAPSIHR